MTSTLTIQRCVTSVRTMLDRVAYGAFPPRFIGMGSISEGPRTRMDSLPKTSVPFHPRGR